LRGAPRQGGIVPVTREVLLDGDTPVSAFQKLHRGKFGFLLESLEGGERWARYTFLATDPREVFEYRGDSMRRWTEEGGWGPFTAHRSPLTHLGEVMRAHPPAHVPGLPRFTGGAVGFMGYDVARTLERLPRSAAR
jgi:anthranilate synthase component 1